MKHATRFKALARQAGGAARSLAHGAVLSVSLMGMGWLGTQSGGAMDVRYGDDPRRQAEPTAAATRSPYDAADDDAATGGPDLARRIFPVVMTATEPGVQQLPVAEVAELTTRVLETM